MAYFNFYASVYEFFAYLKTSVKVFWRYFPNRVYLYLAAFFQALAWLQVYFINKNLSGDLLVLRYKIEFGANLVGEPNLIFAYPFFSLAVVFLNFFLSLLLRKNKNYHFLSQTLLASAVIFSIILCLYLFSVYLVNFR